jgi:predicted nucleotidyltransferase
MVSPELKSEISPRISSENGATLSMVKTTSKIKQRVQRYLQVLSQEIKIDRAILYGSYARHRYTPDSDIDLAIISPDFNSKDYLKYLVLLSEKSAEIGEVIEALPYTPQEDRHPDPRSFLAEIKRTGKTIYRHR